MNQAPSFCQLFQGKTKPQCLEPTRQKIIFYYYTITTKVLITRSSVASSKAIADLLNSGYSCNLQDRDAQYCCFQGISTAYLLLLSKTSRQNKHLVLLCSVPCVHIWFRHLEHEVGFANLAAVRKVR